MHGTCTLRPICLIIAPDRRITSDIPHWTAVLSLCLVRTIPCLKKAPTLTSCSFDKHRLILIILGKQHRLTFKNETHSAFHIPSLYLLYLLSAKYAYNFWKCTDAVIKISLCLSKLQLAKVGAIYEIQCSSDDIRCWLVLWRVLMRFNAVIRQTPLRGVLMMHNYREEIVERDAIN